MVKKDEGWMTREEYHAQLKAEGKWDEHVATLARHEEERRVRRKAKDRDLDPLDDALRAGGVSESWKELRSGPKSYDLAVPILLEHLKKDYPDHVKMTILMILQNPRVKPYWDQVVDLFEDNSANLSEDNLHYVAFVLDEISDESRVDELIRLVQNKKLGVRRNALLERLFKSKSPSARMLLNELKDDPDLKSEIKRLRRLKRYQDK